jgi:hypothetical protein
MPSLVMSSQCLVFWWTTPGLVGLLVLFALPASALVIVFESLRRARVLSTGRVALAFGNVCSVVSLIGILVALEGVEHRPAWLALASWSDTLCGVVLVLTIGSAGFVLPGVVARITPRRNPEPRSGA